MREQLSKYMMPDAPPMPDDVKAEFDKLDDEDAVIYAIIGAIQSEQLRPDTDYRKAAIMAAYAIISELGFSRWKE